MGIRAPNVLPQVESLKCNMDELALAHEYLRSIGGRYVGIFTSHTHGAVYRGYKAKRFFDNLIEIRQCKDSLLDVNGRNGG